LHGRAPFNQSGIFKVAQVGLVKKLGLLLGPLSSSSTVQIKKKCKILQIKLMAFCVRIKQQEI